MTGTTTPEPPYIYTRAHIPTSIGGGLDVIYLGGISGGAAYTTSAPKEFPGFDIKVSETKLIAGRTFTLLAVDSDGAYLRVEPGANDVSGASP